MRLAITVSAIVLATAAQASAEPRQQFDLQCTNGHLVTGRSPFSTLSTTSVRVDLAHGLFCTGMCDAVGKIVSSDDNEIILKQEKDAASGLTTELRVNRISGQLSMTFAGADSPTQTTAWACTPAAFSGFPQPKF